MPELAKLVRFLVVEGVFEVSIAVSELLEELVLRRHGIEVERVTGRKDDDLLGEVAIVRIVEAVWNMSEKDGPFQK